MAVTLRTLKVPSSPPDGGGSSVVHILSNLMSEQECSEIINSHTDITPSNLTFGTIRRREQFIDPTMADMLWERIHEFYDGFEVENEAGEMWVTEGLNPHSRISKYEKQGKFTAHFDYPRYISPNNQTFLSVTIYLNTIAPENKGCTRILRHGPDHGGYWDGEEELEAIASIQPVLGSASVFRDTAWHDGEELLGGVKELMRTDFVFKRVEGAEDGKKEEDVVKDEYEYYDEEEETNENGKN